MERAVQTFTLGKSTVVTIPKSLGVIPGAKMTIKKRGKDLVLKPVGKPTDASSIVNRLAGGLRLKHHPTPEEINELLDKRYEEMLP